MSEMRPQKTGICYYILWVMRSSLFWHIGQGAGREKKEKQKETKSKVRKWTRRQKMK